MSTRQWVRAAAMLTAVAGIAGLLLIDPVVRAIHAGIGPDAVVGLMAGRDFRPAEHYVTLARGIATTPLSGLIAISVIATIATIPDVGPRMSRAADLLDTRKGLLVLGGGVATVSLVLALSLDQPAFRAGIPTSSLTPGPIEVVLSHPTGFYAEDITVVVGADRSVELHYTLDGSQPDPVTNARATRVVAGPIPITDRSEEPNVYADIPTIVEEYTSFTPPSGPVPKATVLRVRGEGTQEVFATYFIGERVAPSTLPTMSLIAEPAYLFDQQIGIRVPGALTDRWRQSDRFVRSPNPPQIEANYQIRGREWERPLRETLNNPVLVQFCAADRSCPFEQSVGIRTHGGWSRSFSPDKSWRLYAREEYGSERFEYQFFTPETPQHARLVLRNSGNDWNRLRFMDAFWHSVFPDDHVDTQAYRPTRLFVNGEYWGIYNIRERQDEHYVENVHGISREHVEMLDNSTGTALQQMRESPAPEGAPRQSPDAPEVWDDWVSFVEELAPPGSGISAIEGKIDIESFYDFVISHTFAGVADWVSNNTRWWRTAAPARSGDVSGQGGRWRFMLADFDSATRIANPLTAGPGVKRIVDDIAGDRAREDGLPAIFGALIRDDRTRVKFLNRYADLMNTALHPERTIRQLDDIVAILEPEMELSRRRWSTGDMDAWHADVEQLRDFLMDRPDAMRTELVEFFNLDGTMTLRLEVDPGLESVVLNTVDLTHAAADTGLTTTSDGGSRWAGDYFLGIPVTLSARAADGSRFVGWAGLPSDVIIDIDGAVTFVPLGDLTLRAVIEPAP